MAYIYIYTLRDFLSKKRSKLCHGPSNISFYMLLHIRICMEEAKVDDFTGSVRFLRFINRYINVVLQ